MFCRPTNVQFSQSFRKGIMINELQKFRIEIFKVSGFAFLTPIGRIFVQSTVVFNEFQPIGFLTYLFICLMLGTLGLNLILKAYDIVELEERKR